MGGGNGDIASEYANPSSQAGDSSMDTGTETADGGDTRYEILYFEFAFLRGFFSARMNLNCNVARGHAEGNESYALL